MPTNRLEPGAWGRIRTYRRPNGKWMAVAQFCDLRGVVSQRSKTGRSEAAAIRGLKDELTGGTPDRGPRITGKTRLRELAQVVLAEKHELVEGGQLSPGTVRNYESHWTLHIKPAMGELALEWVDVQRCDEFLKALRKRSGYPTVKGVRIVLGQILGEAVRRKAIPAPNPVKDCARIPGSRTKPPRALEPAEAVDLWQKLTVLAQAVPEKAKNNRRYRRSEIDPDLPDLVLWMLGTSERIGQAVAVHWPWLDLGQATAALGPNVIRVKGDGLRLNWGTTKTRDRVLDLPEPVVAMLLLRQEVALNPVGPVFPDSFGGLRDPHNTLGELRRALDLAGYDWVTSHVFRKTVATVLDDAGLSARHVADQLGHARPSMTQDRYMKRGARNPKAKAALEAMLATAGERRVIPMDR